MKVGTRDLILTLLLGGVAFGAYLAALPVSYAFWDTGELQTVASILGIAHPPGCPAFVLLGWLFAHAVPFRDDAWRVNAMSSLAVAVAVALVFATARRLAIPPIIASVCTLGFALASATWRYATRAEVHDLALCFSACALYFALRYRDEGKTRDLFAGALSTGLLASTHGVALFLIPALGFALVRRVELPSFRSIVAIAGGFLLGLLPYAYVAPRSAWLFAHHVDPTLSLGLPAGLPFWDYDNPNSPARFWQFVTGADFHVHSGFLGYVAFGRYIEYCGALVHRLGAAYGYAGTIAAAVGAMLLIVERGGMGRALVITALLPVPYTESYADLQDPDRYYLLALWCAAIAIGVCFERFATLLAQPRRGVMRFALALGLVGSFAVADPKRGDVFLQREDNTAPLYVSYIRSVTPDDAVILAEWAYSSPLAYAAYVEHSLGHRIGVPAGATQYVSYFPRWLREGRRLYIVSFDPELAIAHYHVRRISFDQIYFVYKVTP